MYKQIQNKILKNNSKIFLKEFTSRNALFISHEIQNKIFSQRLTFAGVGLGSNIATLAARLGFLHFLLIDGDNVSVSNLNRQNYLNTDVGMNKALCLSKTLIKINPQIKTQTIQKKINTEDVNGIIKSSDIIINTLDFSNAFINLIDKGIYLNKTVIVPFNVGFGVVILVFRKSSVTMKEILNNNKIPIKSDIQLYNLLLDRLDVKLPKYILENINKIFSLMKKYNYSPQLGIASQINSSFILSIIIKIIKGNKVTLAPKAITFDIMNNL